MKIKVVIAEKDEAYTSKLIHNLSGNYSGQLEIYTFSELELLEQFLKAESPDVVLAAEEFREARENVGRKTIFSFLIPYKAEEVDGVPAICKYQKVENIYKQILSLYSELGKNYVSRSGNAEGTKVISFFGISGGAGASTLAAGYAMHQSRSGSKVLYLNLEKLASTRTFFMQEGTAAFDEVLFALKSRKMSLELKIESTVITDASGVNFFAPCANCMDILELTEEDIENLIEGICRMGQYDYLVIDGDFSMDAKMNVICDYSNHIVLVSTGDEISNLKMQKYVTSLHSMEERSKVNIQGKICVIYNKFRNAVCKVVENMEVRNIGGIPRLESAAAIENAKYVAGLTFWKAMEQ